MRRLVRFSVATATLLVLVLVVSVVAAVISVRQSFPEEEGKVTLDGLSRPVEVRRDEWGVPQIYADSSNDLFFAQGYVHAQDRFFEMDFRRHLGSGQLSEWFGEEQLETDKFLRTLGWRNVAETEFEKLSPETRRYLEAYADGVNEYLRGRSGSRISVEYSMGLLGPGEKPRPWEPVDSLVWLKALAWDLRGNMEDEVARVIASTKLSPDEIAELYPEYPYDRNPPIVPNIAARDGADKDSDNGKASTGKDGAGKQGGANGTSRGRPVPELPEGSAEAMAGIREVLADVPSPMAPTSGADGSDDGRAGIGSNSWVVSGSRTTSGKPLLANDPHLSAQVPSIWYQMGLHCRKLSEVCPFDVSGFTFAGLPGVVIGHNERIGWGFTNLGADVTDLFLERIDGDSYLFDGQRLPLEIRREVIAVKGSEPVELNVRSTHHGPLLSDVDDRLDEVADDAPESRATPAGGLETGVSLRWTALDAGRTADAMFQMNTASNWEEFRSAAERFDVPSQNLVYADVDGHIGYQAPGRIPVRRGGTGEWPMPGWTSGYGWEKDYVPFDKLPSVLDPPEGYIVTANNAVTGPSYEPRLADHWSYGYRSGRITDLLTGADKLDVAAMSRIQLDTQNGFASTLVPYLMRIDGLDQFTLEGRETLVDWNYQQDVDSKGAAYFNAVWKNLLGMTFHDELTDSARPAGGDRWYEVVRRLLEEPDSDWWDDKRTKRVREDRDAILAKALKQARLDLTAKLAKDPERWRWGRLHQLELRNQTFGQSGVGLLEALFNRGPYELPGGTDAVLAAGWNTASEEYDVGGLPSMRMVVDLADLDRSRWINLTGSSGHPWSEHYDDQIELWARGKTTAWPFSPKAVERRAVRTLTLVPVGWSS